MVSTNSLDSVADCLFWLCIRVPKARLMACRSGGKVGRWSINHAGE